MKQWLFLLIALFCVTATAPAFADFCGDDAACEDLFLENSINQDSGGAKTKAESCVCCVHAVSYPAPEAPALSCLRRETGRVLPVNQSYVNRSPAPLFEPPSA